MNVIKITSALAVTLIALMTAGVVQAGVLDIAVTGVTQARGHIHVDLCTKDTFVNPKKTCPYSGTAPAVLGATLVRIADVSPGDYAVQVFHDETDTGVVHQNVLGIPREPIGFSNDAPLHLRGPRFQEATFSVGREAKRITLRLRHLLGGH